MYCSLIVPVSGESGRGNVREGIANAAALNRTVFAALKPGGLYVVVAHKGLPGLDAAGMAKLHRIDEALVMTEVEAARFKLDGESQVLADPADSYDVAVYNPVIRGKTDQFVLRFRKPR